MNAFDWPRMIGEKRVVRGGLEVMGWLVLSSQNKLPVFSIIMLTSFSGYRKRLSNLVNASYQRGIKVKFEQLESESETENLLNKYCSL